MRVAQAIPARSEQIQQGQSLAAPLTVSDADE